MIKLHDVNKVYRTDRIETLALTELNLQIKKGEFVSVMGPSGSGKSTLLNIIGLLDEPSEGQVVIGDHDVSSCGDRQAARIRNSKVGFVFQSFHLIRDLTVMDNVEIPLLYRRLPGKTRRAMCREALEKVGLGSRLSHRPGQLSGGQQQRVAIARAIVGKPQIILADEPTGNLDSQTGDEIMKILEGLHSNEETTVVMVTHDQGLADRTERVIRLFDGRQVH